MFDPLHSVRQSIRRRSRLRIVPYRSIGSQDMVTFRGRVLANPLMPSSQPGESALAPIARMTTRFATFEVESIPVEIRIDGASQVAAGTTNREGYFAIDVPLEGLSPNDHWVRGFASLPGRSRSGAERAWPIEARVIYRNTTRLVVSDIDDTLLLNGVGDIARTVLETMRGTFLTRKPVPGTPELYRWLTADGVVPIAYVSSSPWNLYDFLVSFMSHNGFPSGPLHLRDYGFNRATFGGAHGEHKVAAIQEILDWCPDADVVLLGDSSQQDAEAFTAIIDANPLRPVRAFIRDVGDENKAEAVHQLAGRVSEAPGPGSITLIQSAQEIQDSLASTNWA